MRCKTFSKPSLIDPSSMCFNHTHPTQAGFLQKVDHISSGREFETHSRLGADHNLPILPVSSDIEATAGVTPQVNCILFP